MKLLIDGTVFCKGYESLSIARFWATIVPMIVGRLKGCEVFFLNRGSALQFRDVVALQHLFAPQVRWDAPAIEFQRLAALCKEYEIDMFLSTYGTSAGSQIKSLFVDPLRQPEYGSESEKKAVRYAAQLATVRFAAHAEGQERIASLVGDDVDRIECLYPAGAMSVSTTTIANTIAQRLLKLSSVGHARADYPALMAQKEIIYDLSQQMHAVYDDAGWRNYIQYLDHIKRLQAASAVK